MSRKVNLVRKGQLQQKVNSILELNPESIEIKKVNSRSEFNQSQLSQEKSNLSEKVNFSIKLTID